MPSAKKPSANQAKFSDTRKMRNLTEELSREEYGLGLPLLDTAVAGAILGFRPTDREMRAIATLMFQRASGGVRHPVERTMAELITLAKTVAIDGMPASENPYIRQKLAQFAAEARCIRLGRYRAMSAQLKGRPPGPASSIGKLCATELNLRLAMFADEMLALYANLESESIGTVECGKWTNRIIAAREFTIAGGTSSPLR